MADGMKKESSQVRGPGIQAGKGEMHQDVMGLLRQQTEMLQIMIDLKSQTPHALKSLENSIGAAPLLLLSIWHHMLHHYPYHSMPGDSKENQSFMYTDRREPWLVYV